MITVEIAKKQRDLDFIASAQVSMAMESEGMELNKETVLKGAEYIFRNPSIGSYYIAHNGDQTMGCLLTLLEWSDWRCSNVIWVHSVYVSPDFRRQGVYRKMYSHLKEIVKKDENYCGIRLYVEKENERAIKTYQSLGMDEERYSLFEWMPNH